LHHAASLCESAASNVTCTCRVIEPGYGHCAPGGPSVGATSWPEFLRRGPFARWSKAMTIEQRENVLAEFDAAPMPRPVGDVDPVVLTSHTRTIAPIIRAYDSYIVRLYCLLRFRILRGRFL